MDWKKLLITTKLWNEIPPKALKDYPMSDFEKDYEKIVSSAAFRRLQDKTQVFPLDKSDFIRTRLTHSIEVSTIARQLGIMMIKKLEAQGQYQFEKDTAENIPAVLQCAGLLHDLGNPPFGHFGESIIGDWFKENLDTILYKDTTETPLEKRKTLRKVLTPELCKDLENFEGNAQSFRILAKARHRAEINVSYAVMSTLVKYPTDSSNFNKNDPDIKRHKPGFYTAERDIFSKISDCVGTRLPDGTVCRHPLTFLLEAADDIAYRTADIEDAFKKKLFSLNEFVDFFKDNYDQTRISVLRGGSHYVNEHYSDDLIKDLEDKGKVSSPEDAFRDWVAYTRQWLMHNVVYSFSKNYDGIMSGTMQKDLFANINHTITMRIFKKAMETFVYCNNGILRLELSAQPILSSLLERFTRAVLYHGAETNDFKPTKADKKLWELLANNYKEDYEAEKQGHETDEAYCLYLRLIMVTDYISGMTDSYAQSLYRELNGIG